MTQQEFVERVRQLVGAAEREELKPPVLCVLRALAERLGDDGYPAFEEALEHALGAVPSGLYGLAGATHPGTFGARVCALTGLSPARSRELAQAVCQALAERVPRDVLAPLVAHAPLSERPLFALPGARGLDPEEVTHRAGGHGVTLATGRPGSQHPLSQARPPERAQSESVVVSENPHGATKLSSSRRPTQ